MSVQETATAAKATAVKAKAKKAIALATALDTINSKVTDDITKAIYTELLSIEDRPFISTEIRDFVRKRFNRPKLLRRDIRDRVRYLCTLGLVTEQETIKGRTQKVFLYKAVRASK